MARSTLISGVLRDRGDPRNRAAWERHLPPGVSLKTIDLLAGQTLPRAWHRRWEDGPDRPAVFDLTDERESTLTRGDLDRRTAALAAGLWRLGLRPQDRVLISAASSAPLVLLYVAVLRLGAVAVPANTAYRERELQHIVRDCQPAMAIMDGDERAIWARRASERGERLPIVDPMDTRSLEAAAGPPVDLDTAGPEDLALICYTSGTTGAPKGAMLSHANLLAGAEALRLAWRWEETDGLVFALPLFHMHGLGVGLHGSLLAGAGILLLPGFEAQQVLQACGRPQATLFFGVPTMYVRLTEALAADSAQAAVLRSKRLLVSGSAPLLPAVWHQVRDRTGQAILERYGMSETVMNISNPYDGERRPGSIGLPLPGVEVRITDGEREVRDDATGEIQVRGPNVFAGYWNRPDATAQALTPDGWLHTGDMGRRGADGYLTVAGRSKELIITGGYNVFPQEVEEAAVVGRPSREWGEKIVAFIVPADPHRQPSPAELEAFCRARLAAFKRPRDVRFVERLPRNAMGKLMRSELRDP